MKHTVRVDCLRALRQDFHFWFAQFAIERMNLTIDIADANVVHIYQCQFTHPRTGQRFHRPGPNPAQPDHTNVSAQATLDGGAGVNSVDYGTGTKFGTDPHLGSPSKITNFGYTRTAAKNLFMP